MSSILFLPSIAAQLNRWAADWDAAMEISENQFMFIVYNSLSDESNISLIKFML